MKSTEETPKAMTRSDGGNVNRHVSSSFSPIRHKGTTETSDMSETYEATRATKTTGANSSSINTIGPVSSVRMILTCLIGLALSGYATYVEIQVEKDDDYQAMCDISEKISCTKVFSSRYGKGFGIVGWFFGQESVLNTPNGELGMVFYILVGILSLFDNVHLARLQLFLIVLSNCMSVYLAYLLYFVLDDLCVVCVGTYIVNLILLVQAWQRYYPARHDDATKLD